MNKIFHFIAENSVVMVLGILVFFGLIEAIFGYLSESKRTKNDVMVEVFNTFFLIVIAKPLIAFVSFGLCALILPNQNELVMGLPLWLNILIFVLVDDFLQYWYHRSAHEYKLLWKWHRPHHAATEMGLLVSYREAIYYFLFIPNLWWLGIYTFLGGGVAVAIGIVLKQFVIISSHSLATWDAVFYRNKALTPIIKVVERIFITPAFHHSHHAVSSLDNVGNPEGNFGNMFSIWDQLFGTARFIHEYPEAYGLQNDPEDSWMSHAFYPLIKSDKEGSEISKDYTFEKTTELKPVEIKLTPGDYLYCDCGYSKTQPFCDGSHHGTKFSPIKFTVEKERTYKLCQCKLSKKSPFCDNSHISS